MRRNGGGAPAAPEYRPSSECTSPGALAATEYGLDQGSFGRSGRGLVVGRLCRSSFGRCERIVLFCRVVRGPRKATTCYLSYGDVE